MVKTITIREEIYLQLVKIKKSNESFSQLFSRLMKEGRPIEVLSSIRGTMDFKDKEKMIKEIKNKRQERRK